MKREIVKRVEQLLRQAIAEDLGIGDITTDTVLKKNVQVRARIIAQEVAVVCGTKVVGKIASMVDKKIKVVIKRKDGMRIQKGDVVLSLYGPARSLLKIERICLNFLGRLSSIATITAAYVAKAKRYGVDVYDTRKTTPNLRLFERCAVQVGGGCNHRFGLFDQVLIKDNHVMVAERYEKGTTIETLVKRAQTLRGKGILVEVEVDTLTQLKRVLKMSPDIVLLDNMSPKMLRRAVAIVKRVVKENDVTAPVLEASGGITLKNIKNVARTGIDRVSIGALTHSATNINYSLEIV